MEQPFTPYVPKEHVQKNLNFKLYCVVRPFNSLIDLGIE